MVRKYPAVIILGAVVTGIILADNVAIPAWLYLVLSLIMFPVAIASYYKNNNITTCSAVLIALVMLSAFGFSFRYKTFPPRHIIHFTDSYQKYQIFGTVDDWPILREHRTSIYIDVDSLAQSGETTRTSGRIILNIGTETTRFQFGDRLQFESSLYSIKGGKNPSGFDYQRYLNLKNVFASAYLSNQYSVLVDQAGAGYYMRLIDKLRKAIGDTFKETLSPSAAALASGFLIGETRDIPVDIYQLFRDSGTLHLLAVSGSNVALVLLVFIFLLRASPMKARNRTIFLLGVVLVFTLLSYNQPSVVRASIMASLILLGQAFQRKIDLNNIIATTALIILLIKPTEFFDVGFQLSFATAWGLIFLTPIVTRHLRPIHNRLYYKLLIFPLIISVVAQIVALPMSAFYFHRLPMISFVSNLFVVPLVSIIVVGEVTILLATFLLPLFGSFVGSLVEPFLQLTLLLLNQFGSEKMAMVQTFELFPFQLLAYYLMLVFLAFSIGVKQSRRLLVIACLIFANLALFNHLLSEKYDYQITIFSSSGGTVALAETDETFLIPSDLPLKNYSITEKTALPYLANKNIENYSVVALSNDYSTIKEVLFILNQNDSVDAFIPVLSKNLFFDINADSLVSVNKSRVKYYEESGLPEKFINNQTYLNDNFMLFCFDSLNLTFLNSSKLNEKVNQLYENSNSINIIVKAVIDKSDILAILSDSGRLPQYLLCQRLTKPARDEINQNYSNYSADFKIIEISQVGAVELFMQNGRLRQIKCGNYNIF